MGLRRNLLRLLALLFAFALVAAACGSSDDDDSSSSSSESATATADDHGDDDDHDHEEEEDTGGTLSQDAVEKAVSGEGGDDAAEEEASDCPVDRSSMEGIFAEADCNRDAIIAMITEKMEAGEWGVGDDGILRGPTGFEIDINECPADWSDTGGVTADSVRIGHTTAQSGNLAAYGNIAVGWDSYNNYVNENGGIGGLDIELLSLIHI